ncbi:MAG: flagellar motor protein MotA [Alphaproteobacteria bacterium]|nr:flagellar motor protein MotA [Alphaproteobacteria bacterium]
MMTPNRYLKRMVLFLIAITCLSLVFIGSIKNFFMANPLLNGAILSLLIFGIFYQIRQVLLLKPEYNLIEALKRHRDHLPQNSAKLRLLNSLFSMLRAERDQIKLSPQSLRTVLDGVASRLDEDREISRYLTRILIFFGLLGTFWGLLETIQSVGGVINALPSGEANSALLFGDLKNQLKAPLGGMGTGFSSSLFGLTGSLVLGFLDLQAGQAQNQFYRQLEDWLSTQTKLTSSKMMGEGDSVPAYLSALLEKTADSLDHLTKLLSQDDHNKRIVDARLLTLTERLTFLSDQMQTEQTVLLRLAEGQKDIRPILKALSEHLGNQQSGFDEITKNHIRSLDLALQHLVQDASRGRDQFVSEIKGEIRLLARTISQVQNDKNMAAL